MFVAGSQIARSLLAELDDLVRSIVEELWEGSPGYDPDLLRRREVEELAAYHLELALSLLAEGRTIEKGELTRTQRLGASRALQGVPIQSVIWGFRVGERVLINAFLSHAREGDIDAVRDGLRRLGQTFDTLTDAAARAYRDTQHEITVHYERLQTDLVDKLLAQPEGAPLDVAERAQLVGTDPDLPCYAVAFALPTTYRPESMLRVRRHLLSAIGPVADGQLLSGSSGAQGLVVVPWTRGLEPLVAALERLLASADLRVDPILGIGERSEQLGGVGRSARQALRATEIGLKLDRRRTLVRFDDVIPEVLLAHNAHARRRLVDSRLGALLGRHELVETLRAYLDSDRSQKRTALALHVHPNTVAYRLNRIEEVLGRELDRTGTLVDVSLALRGLDLDRAHAVPERRVV